MIVIIIVCIFYDIHIPSTYLLCPQSSDVREEYSVWRCYETGSVPYYFDVMIFIYLALLQFVGIILAFQTRRVKINILNDSKAVASLVYISSIVLVVIVLVTFILRSYINVSAALFSGGIFVLATFFLLLMFVPKVSNIFQSCDYGIILVPMYVFTSIGARASTTHVM